MRCAVFGCNADDQSKDFNKGDVMFFRFPTDVTIRKAWQTACCRKDIVNPKNARVCSKHFKNSDYARNLKYELLGCPIPKNCRLIKPDAIPSENLPKSSVSRASICKRQQKTANGNRSKLVDVPLNKQKIQIENSDDGRNFPDCEGVYLCIDNNAKETNIILTRDTGTNTEVDDRDEIIAELRKKVQRLESEAEVLNTLLTPTQIKVEF